MLKLLERIWKVIFDFRVKDIQKVKSDKHDYQWIAEKLKQLPNSGAGVRWDRLDENYWACSESDIKNIAKWDLSSWNLWRPEKFDCDNFALVFMAHVNFFFGINSVGLLIDHDTKHAYNIIVLSDGNLRVFEPQLDRWPTLGEGKYKCEKGVLVM